LGGNLLKAEEMPISDFAADLLLERKIDDHGYLLTGHYSRFKFNHPGPFFFYAYHAMHRLLDAWQLPPSVGAYAATMALKSSFLSRAFCWHTVQLGSWRPCRMDAF